MRASPGRGALPSSERNGGLSLSIWYESEIRPKLTSQRKSLRPSSPTHTIETTSPPASLVAGGIRWILMRSGFYPVFADS